MDFSIQFFPGVFFCPGYSCECVTWFLKPLGLRLPPFLFSVGLDSRLPPGPQLFVAVPTHGCGCPETMRVPIASSKSMFVFSKQASSQMARPLAKALIGSQLPSAMLTLESAQRVPG